MNLKSKKERREQIFAPQRLSNGRVRRFDAPQGLTLLEFVQQGLRLTTRRAFSIAEAMIVFTIVSVAIASVAPMISKQVKYNEMADVQAKVLNQRIEEVKKSAWKLTPDKKSITRPDDNVGIGVSAGTNPSAKLDVAGNIKVSTADKGTEINCDYDQIDCPIRAKIGSLTRFVVRNSGGVFLRPKDDTTKFLIQDDNGQSQMGYFSDYSFGMKRRKLSNDSDVYTLSLNKFGQMFLYAPTREEVITTPDTIVRNDATAFSIRWPEDSDPKYDCGVSGDANGKCTPTTNDGYTQTAVFTSNGSLYINSINNAGNKQSFTVRNGDVNRMWVRQNGTIIIRSENDADDTNVDNKSLIIMKPLGTKRANGSYDNSQYAYIKNDGSAYFAGTVNINGKDVNKALLDKIAINEEEIKKSNQLIAESKNLILELKAENEELKEKLAMFEEQLLQIALQNNNQINFSKNFKAFAK